MLFSDQLNIISKYVNEIKNEQTASMTFAVSDNHNKKCQQPSNTPQDFPEMPDTTEPQNPSCIHRFLHKIFEGVPPIVRHLFDITYDDPVPSNRQEEPDILISNPEVQAGG